jgi:hypothetical protein
MGRWERGIGTRPEKWKHRCSAEHSRFHLFASGKSTRQLWISVERKMLSAQICSRHKYARVACLNTRFIYSRADVAWRAEVTYPLVVFLARSGQTVKKIRLSETFIFLWLHQVELARLLNVGRTKFDNPKLFNSCMRAARQLVTCGYLQSENRSGHEFGQVACLKKPGPFYFVRRRLAGSRSSIAGCFTSVFGTKCQEDAIGRQFDPPMFIKLNLRVY